ncbi:GMC oxidoreductase [Athelia psychrophila]|uniref:GMC oxidoreductase n=1 Tax=Athelia psychrophila TaxID=1759441 RepID=A0A166TCX3_9AGAM|nr:GMC oxidoreductase [Fibularhizoctonia sp. CBS 109695]
MIPSTLSSFLLSIVLLASLCLAAVVTDPSQADGKTFDYIVVGAGLTGITVAARLAEDTAISVLLIEAGQDNRSDANVYNLTDWITNEGSSLDWAWPTDQGKVIHGGKTLGGSSSINGALYTRGLAAQYDAWSSLLETSESSSGWNWEGLLGYMMKSENFSAPNAAQSTDGAGYNSSDHGISGPVQVAFPEDMFDGTQQSNFISAAGNLLTMSSCSDLSAGSPNCASFIPLTVNAANSDRRSSSAEAYLTPVENTATNWLTLTGQLVTQITWANSSLPLTATGVQFGPTSGGSTRYSAKASREVILAAGAIQTPALLQLSGVGDATILGPLGITTVLNITTVGRNLQEQTQNTISVQAHFTENGTGPSDVVAYPNIYQAFGDNATAVVSDMQSSLASWAASQANNALSADALAQIYQVQANLIINSSAPILEEQMTTKIGKTSAINTLSIDMWQLLPFSRGNVSIASTDPFTPPNVSVNFFSVPWDLAVQTMGARRARELFLTAPLNELVIDESEPGPLVPAKVQNGTDEAWQAWITLPGGGFHTVSHPIGTCAMMRFSLGGVVDAQLVIYNTTNVRVVDASIIPLQLSAHLSASLYGVAEKAADLIKNRGSPQSSSNSAGETAFGRGSVLTGFIFLFLIMYMY